jgi:hypothetical protein
MSAKLSIEKVVSNLEQREAFLRQQKDFHAQQESHHGEQRAACAAELETVLKSLEVFRAALALAEDPALLSVPAPAAQDEATLPPPNRLMVSRLLRLVVESPGLLEEPFGPTAVAAEVNRRFANRLREPVGPRPASDVLRRMLAEGDLQRVRKGKASHEALYRRTPARSE